MLQLNCENKICSLRQTAEWIILCRVAVNIVNECLISFVVSEITLEKS